MVTIISGLIILASVLLVFIVFIQNPKGGGLSSDFGAAHQLGGVQKTNDFIEKSTWVLALVIGACSIILTIKTTPETKATPKPGTEAKTSNPQTGGGAQGKQP